MKEFLDKFLQTKTDIQLLQEFVLLFSPKMRRLHLYAWKVTFKNQSSLFLKTVVQPYPVHPWSRRVTQLDQPYFQRKSRLVEIEYNDFFADQITRVHLSTCFFLFSMESRHFVFILILILKIPVRNASMTVNIWCYCQ